MPKLHFISLCLTRPLVARIELIVMLLNFMFRFCTFVQNKFIKIECEAPGGSRGYKFHNISFYRLFPFSAAVFSFDRLIFYS